MNIFDWINFYYVVSVNILVYSTIKVFEIKTKKWKKILAIIVGLSIAGGFGVVDYFHSQKDFAEEFQKLFLSFTVAIVFYDYTIKMIVDFFKEKK